MNFLSLCYHYIRPKKDGLLGQTEAEFEAHLDMLQENYEMLSPADLFSKKKLKKTGMLVTFDDGLFDHARAAEILSERNLKGMFFIPTCIFQDGLPPNPTIIHYILDRYRITGFIEAYRMAQDIEFYPEIDTSQPTLKIIHQIKSIFKYGISQSQSRAILVRMYQSTLLRDDPAILFKMNLRVTQLLQIMDQGHTIGIHSRTHPSVVKSNFEIEINEPRNYMSRRFATPIKFFSYPFGHKDRDCLDPETFRKKQKGYKFAFTVEEKLNTEKTDPFDLGRLMPHSTDTPEILKNKLEDIEYARTT